jgi:hypothetical protein
VSAQVQFGIKGGYNLATLTLNSETFVTRGNLSGFNAGLMASIPVASQLFLQPEAVYSQQGNTAIVHAYTGDQQLTATYNYLNLPILFKYQRSSGLFAESGPQFGILLNVKFVAENAGQSTSKEDNQPMDFGWVFGLGYKIPKLNLGLDIRYNLGLTNTNRYNPPGSQAVCNRVFQVGLFYFFKHL